MTYALCPSSRRATFQAPNIQYSRSSAWFSCMLQWSMRFNGFHFIVWMFGFGFYILNPTILQCLVECDVAPPLAAGRRRVLPAPHHSGHECGSRDRLLAWPHLLWGHLRAPPPQSAQVWQALVRRLRVLNPRTPTQRAAEPMLALNPKTRWTVRRKPTRIGVLQCPGAQPPAQHLPLFNRGGEAEVHSRLSHSAQQGAIGYGSPRSR